MTDKPDVNSDHFGEDIKDTKLFPIDDPGFCGMAPLQTGKWDPFWKSACQNHDKAYNSLKLGLNNGDGGLEVFGQFVSNIGLEMAKGAYAVVAGPFYILIGGVGGLLRWFQLGGAP